jgi:hypothetical protein
MTKDTKKDNESALELLSKLDVETAKNLKKPIDHFKELQNRKKIDGDSN